MAIIPAIPGQITIHPTMAFIHRQVITPQMGDFIPARDIIQPPVVIIPQMVIIPQTATPTQVTPALDGIMPVAIIPPIPTIPVAQEPTFYPATVVMAAMEVMEVYANTAVIGIPIIMVVGILAMAIIKTPIAMACQSLRTKLNILAAKTSIVCHTHTEAMIEWGTHKIELVWEIFVGNRCCFCTYQI